MQLENVSNTIQKGMQEYQNNTFFLANYIKCNLATRAKISSLISENGKIEGLGLQVLVDNEIGDGVAYIGMGNGPTFATIQI
jgi:hypothetical protein